MSELMLPLPSGHGSGGEQPEAGQPPGPDPRALLFTGGPRLGWSFRDRRELVPAFQEPKPGPQAIADTSAARTEAAQARLDRAWKWAGKPSIGLALVLVLLAAWARTAGDSGFSPVIALITVVVFCGPGLGYCAWCWLERDKARDAPPERLYQQALGGWEQRATAHQNDALQQLVGQPEWGSADVPERRTDVFGGSMAGWESLLAVHGASLIGARRPLLIADLTGLQPSGPLFTLARAAGAAPVTWRLPADLGRSGIMASLTAPQIASAIAEALHAGTPGGARNERALDKSILEQLGAALASGGVTLPRLAAAVRAARGQNPGPGLTADEHHEITSELFPEGPSRDQAAPGLSRLMAVLPGLAKNAGEGWPARPAACTCITVGSGERDAGTEILSALLVQWITGMVRAAPGPACPAVIVTGADQVTRSMLEQLADACDLRAAPLTLLFRHLRDDAVDVLGGAAVTAFMRLGNHREAEQAAGYIGRHHTFAVSSLTATRGTSTTKTSGGGLGGGTSDTVSDARNRGWQGGGLFGTADSRSSGTSRTTGTSTSQNWSENWSTADGTNESEALGRQRVYEYRVEPTELQNLPDLMLLVADRNPRAVRIRAVECDPTIVTRPGVSTRPLPPAPLFSQAGPLLPAVSGPNTVAPALRPAGAAGPSWPRSDAGPADSNWPASRRPPDLSWPRSGPDA